MIRIIPLIVATFCLLNSTGLKAEEKTVLVVELEGGTSVRFYTSENLTMTPDGDNVVFQSTSETASYARSAVVAFHFEKSDDGSAVDNVSDVWDTVFLLQGNHIVITHPESLSTPLVFNVQGVRFPAPVARISEQSARISIAGLPSGLYVITVNDQSFKFLKQ